MSRPTLDNWLSQKIGKPFTRRALEEYQLARLNETIALAREHSKYYAQRLPSGSLRSIRELEKLPFTRPEELYAEPYAFLCVSPREVERITTVATSGSSGTSKRLFFTADDIELCADFFHHGMKLLVDETDRVGILFPANAPGSVGELLARGLQRGGTDAVQLFPLIGDAPALIETIRRENITSLAGFPSILQALAESCPDLPIRSVLLSADYVSPDCRATIKNAWGAEVFEHYGMTEMGLGCAVSCEQQRGYHIREADILIEIIDPESGRVLPEGEPGEVVFTTLTRRAMPLIRYRTGDMSRFIPGPCPCGTALLTLAHVGDRGLRKNIPLPKKEVEM
ncbi:MAG: AMP-binding protein [Clostridiales bacterium]|nr:AMP-binding protein [Clostridiales bacterium]